MSEKRLTGGEEEFLVRGSARKILKGRDHV